MPANNKTFISLAEAAELLGVGRNLIYDSARRGDLPCVRLGRRILVHAEKLQAMATTGNAGPPRKSKKVA